MPWVVNTCLLLDIGLDDPMFAKQTEKLILSKQSDGLVICPITYVELAPAFGGKFKPQEEFLCHLGIDYHEEWSRKDTLESHAAWQRQVQLRRSNTANKRPIADILIGRFAMRFQGLLTRNSKDFTQLFPHLSVVEPKIR